MAAPRETHVVRLHIYVMTPASLDLIDGIAINLRISRIYIYTCTADDTTASTILLCAPGILCAKSQVYAMQIFVFVRFRPNAYVYMSAWSDPCVYAPVSTSISDGHKLHIRRLKRFRLLRPTLLPGNG